MREPTSSDLDQIRAAIAAGRKIEAIRLFRQATGRGLKESKDAVDAMALGLSAPPAAPAPGSPDDVMARAQQAISEGRIIEAIKIIRQMSGTDLKSAKDMVESMSRNPGAPLPTDTSFRAIKPPSGGEDLDALQRRLTGGATPSGGAIAGRFFLLLLGVAIVLYGAYLYFGAR